MKHGKETMSVLHQFFSRTPDAVFAIDDAHHVVFHNPAFARILQCPAAQITGHKCHEVLCGSALNGQRFCGPDCRVARDVARGRTTENFDLVISKPDRQLAWLSVGVSTLSRPVDHAAAIFVLRPVSAIQAVSGFTGYPPILLKESSPQEKTLTLTRRERQILQHLTDGLGTEAIARTMHISRITVRRHLQNLFAKLGVHSRAEAVSLAFRNHFFF